MNIKKYVNGIKEKSEDKIFGYYNKAAGLILYNKSANKVYSYRRL